jgi:hypothetical protein
MTELKSCPFCGDDSPSALTGDNDVAATCLSCGAAGPPCAVAFGIDWRQAEAEAIRAWNTRSPVSDGGGKA